MSEPAIPESYRIADLLRSRGISTLPCKKDKTPVLGSWKHLQEKTPTDIEMDRWFKKDHSIALVAGRVQCLDFDEKYSKGILHRFSKRCEEFGLDYLVGQLMQQQTPSGGFHFIWECDSPIGNLKLANRATTPEERKNPHDKVRVMIETRGHGGYFLIDPSPGYKLIRGDWSAIPILSEEDRDALISVAKTFNEEIHAEEHKEPERAKAIPESETTPGDDYDFRADIPALLKAHGWTQIGPSGKYWTRPGKTKSVSATWDIIPDRFYVFSTSTQFEPQHVYRPWHVYAMLECNGDFSRAALELRRQGFGSARAKKPARDEWRPQIEYQEPQDPTPIEYAQGVAPSGNAPTTETEEDRIRRLINARRFDGSKVPPPLRPVYSIGGIVISTPGNLTAITAQAKVGKSSLVAAMMAATMADPAKELDLLRVSGFNPEGKAVIYVDTEQAPDDFWHTVQRSKRRAQNENLPDWIRAFTVADLPSSVARKSIGIELADAAASVGGVHSIIIDGVADLVLDVNDAQECNDLVAELHSLAIRYDCSVICVIHKNPGSEKVRGHLGSQIERKSETNLSLEKEDEATLVWSNKQRRSPITKQQGIRFKWDDELKMHVSVEEGLPSKKETNKVRDMLELAEGVLKPGDKLGYSAFVGALQEIRRTPSGVPSERSVERWIKSMRDMGIVGTEFGYYFLKAASI